MTKNKIIKAIQDHGGKVFIVGGAVRDELLGIESKDIDFLVQFLDFSQIKEAINHLGKVLDQEIGGKISTLKATVDGEEFDIAIPRINETSTGNGHGDFLIVTDPCAPIASDLARRDFTINALAKNCEGKIIDLFGGQEDIKNRLIRAVGNPEDRFKEDPLRMLRALQFSVRLNFEIEKETAEAIRDLKSLLKSISNERIFMEFEKAWTKGSSNSETFIRTLNDLDVGQELFGDGFKPIPIKIEGSHEEKLIGNFISFFLFGSPQIETMRPTNEMIDFLNVSRKLIFGEPLIWKWIKRKHFLILEQVFSQVRYAGDIVLKLKRIKLKPISGKELDISGHELMALGLKGKEIGKAQNDLIAAIFREELANNKEELKRWIKINQPQ